MGCTVHIIIEQLKHRTYQALKSQCVVAVAIQVTYIELYTEGLPMSFSINLVTEKTLNRGQANSPLDVLSTIFTKYVYT